MKCHFPSWLFVDQWLFRACLRIPSLQPKSICLPIYYTYKTLGFHDIQNTKWWGLPCTFFALHLRSGIVHLILKIVSEQSFLGICWPSLDRRSPRSSLSATLLRCTRCQNNYVPLYTTLELPIIFRYSEAHETQYLVLFINIYVALQIHQFSKFAIHISAEKKKWLHWKYTPSNGK